LILNFGLDLCPKHKVLLKEEEERILFIGFLDLGLDFPDLLIGVVKAFNEDKEEILIGLINIS
jgi:hypothetical protein